MRLRSTTSTLHWIPDERAPITHRQLGRLTLSARPSIKDLLVSAGKSRPSEAERSTSTALPLR
jgi:hypothetical protein